MGFDIVRKLGCELITSDAWYGSWLFTTIGQTLGSAVHNTDELMCNENVECAEIGVGFTVVDLSVNDGHYVDICVALGLENVVI